MLTVGSVFSGIAGDMGLEQAGMTVLWRVENNRYCRQVLQHHYPDTPLYGDVQGVDGTELPRVQLLCGGFPCQDLSTANSKRKGLAGARSGLFWEFIRLARELHPKWILLENVPGLLNSNGGWDMATVLGALGECGYGWAYRILDSQFFGVPQRRRRVFIVGYLGDWRPAGEVLFEREGLSGHTKAKREAGALAPTLFASGAGTGRVASAGSEADFLIVGGGSWPTLSEDSVPTLTGRRGDQTGLLARTITAREGLRHADPSTENYVIANTLGSHHFRNNQEDNVVITQGVRRLTPVECERLQGFPDFWTEGLADTRRYMALGNAWTVPVIKWLGERIIKYDT